MTPATTPALKLNNGVTMPAIGLGVFQTPPDVTTAAVEEALHLGYRHIDTAAAYANEREVGEGIRRSGIARDEVFLETKVWISDYGYDATLHRHRSARRTGPRQHHPRNVRQGDPRGVRPLRRAVRRLPRAA